MQRRIALIAGIIAGAVFARQESIHFLRLSSVQPLATSLAATGEKIPDLTDRRQWDGWIRQHDTEMRSRLERSIEDSISFMILFDTSFTTLPKFAAVPEAVNPGGDLTPAARARVDAFLEALDRMDGERFRLILQFLRRRQITQEELRAYLCGNLRRAALERPRPNSNGALPAAAMETALRNLKDQGKAPVAIRRIAVIGPGFNPEYDPNAYNLFAGLEAALHSGLAKPANLELKVLDINPWVLLHIRSIGAKGGERYRARFSAQDLNIVTQSLEPGAFDLVVANGVLAGYNRLDQALALVNIAQMMATGGILLASGGPLQIVPPDLESLGRGDTAELAIYRRR